MSIFPVWHCNYRLQQTTLIICKDDFKFAEEQAARVGKDCILYMQPEWSKSDKMIPEIVDYVMKNPKWKVSLQTHKYLNIP